MQDSIERSIDLAAPIDRVWRAVSDHVEFGQWFRTKVAAPFAVGARVHCQCLYPGLEHLTWDMTILEITPPTRFVYSWPAYYGEDDPVPPGTPDLQVAFHLMPHGAGTRLTITESGFAALPPDKAPTAFRLNTQGWDEQINNISAHVLGPHAGA